jgi:hypothetical protein
VEHSFDAFAGFSMFSQFTAIVGALLYIFMLMKASTQVEAFVRRIEFEPWLYFIYAITFSGIIMLIIAIFIAAFNRSNIDGGIQCYGPLLLLFCFVMFMGAMDKTYDAMDNRCHHFYKKYCIADGSLKDEHRRRNYGGSHYGSYGSGGYGGNYSGNNYGPSSNSTAVIVRPEPIVGQNVGLNKTY